MKRSGLVSLVAACVAVVAAVATVNHTAHSSVQRPNVVVIVLDTVRRDFVDLCVSAGASSSVTPGLCELAANGTVFTNAWANAPWTLPSHASMFTGLTPSEHGCLSHSVVLREDATTLAEVLAGSGYETAAFFSNPWLNGDVSGLLRGFKTINEAHGSHGAALSNSDQGGAEVVITAKRWLESRDTERPFFMFINILEAHLPYEIPERLATLSGGDPGDIDAVSVEWAHKYNAGLHPPQWQDRERINRLYEADVCTADWLMVTVLAALESRGLWDDTIVIVTSDHGENLGDHGFMDHQFGVFETLLAVPLIIRAPGIMPAGERDDPVMLSDLFATLTDLAGVQGAPVPPGSTSLAGDPLPEDRPVTAEYGGAQSSLIKRLKEYNSDLDESRLSPAYSTVRVGRLRLTVGSDGSTALHDVVADPAQTRDLSTASPAVAEELAGLLPGPPPTRAPSSEAAGLSEDTEERLRTLGYLQ